MLDGDFTIYVIEIRSNDEEPWRDAPFDQLGSVWEPYVSAWERRFPKSREELKKVHSMTGYDGYFTLQYALSALERLREANQDDNRQLRLVKITLNKTTRPINKLAMDYTQKRLFADYVMRKADCFRTLSECMDKVLVMLPSDLSTLNDKISHEIMRKVEDVLSVVDDKEVEDEKWLEFFFS